MWGHALCLILVRCVRAVWLLCQHARIDRLGLDLDHRLLLDGSARTHCLRRYGHLTYGHLTIGTRPEQHEHEDDGDFQAHGQYPDECSRPSHSDATHEQRHAKHELKGKEKPSRGGLSMMARVLKHVPPGPKGFVVLSDVVLGYRPYTHSWGTSLDIGSISIWVAGEGPSACHQNCLRQRPRTCGTLP